VTAERVREGVVRALWAVAGFTWNIPRNVLIGFIRAWRLLISPLYGPTCKYYPSCSAYGLEAVRRHGAVRGSALTVWRIMRCNPWSLGGVDDVPPARERGRPMERSEGTAGPDPACRPPAHDHDDRAPRRAA
jgi:hypothetical protein